VAEKIERFGLVLTPAEKQVLEALAEKERITAAAVIRRLVWSAGQQAQIPAAVGFDNPT
jgi:DNA-binding MarR family transcriptional regulator